MVESFILKMRSWLALFSRQVRISKDSALASSRQSLEAFRNDGTLHQPLHLLDLNDAVDRSLATLSRAECKQPKQASPAKVQQICAIRQAVRNNVALVHAFCAERFAADRARRPGGKGLGLTESWHAYRRSRAAFIESLISCYPQRSRETIVGALDAELEEIYTERQLLQRMVASTYDKTMSPNDYEHFCAGVLRNYGWETEVTKTSGDQGADIVARKAGVRAVIQTKKYSNPVGNEAVQQIYAAQAHYGATIAAVISTAGFTRSARELAHSTRVHLMHHDQLGELPTTSGPDPLTQKNGKVEPAPWTQPTKRQMRRLSR